MSTPTLPVVNLDAAIAFYERAGFTIRRYMESDEPGGFAFVDFDGVSVFDLSEEPDLATGTNRAACYLVTKDADGWHARLSNAGLPVTVMSDRP